MGKPFNPLLGETYQLEQDDFRIFCEQVDMLKLEDKESNLMIVPDESTVHSSYMNQAFLKKEKLKSLLLPGNSPGLNPIENCFWISEEET